MSIDNKENERNEMKVTMATDIILTVFKKLTKEERIHVVKKINQFNDDEEKKCRTEDSTEATEELPKQLPEEKKKETQAIKLGKKMLAGEIKDDIPYFLINRKLIQFHRITPNGKRKDSCTGNLKPLADLIERLGYIQVHSGCAIKKSHVFHIDYKYIYLDTMEKVRIGEKFRARCKEQLLGHRKNIPNWKIKSQEYKLVGF
jgi:hypothetical protein